MLLTVNIGNTNTVCGLFHKGKLREKVSAQTVAIRDVEACKRFINKMLAGSTLAAGDVHGIAVASVVPEALTAVRQVCRECFSKEPLVVTPDLDFGITIGYKSPQTLGADRIVNAAAAFDKYGKALIVVDAGTATTLDYVSDNGMYEGGAIAPGIAMMRDALSRTTAQLPAVDIAWNGTIIGKTTVECLQTGIVAGYICMIEGLLARMEQETKRKTITIATGGLTSLLAQYSSRIDAKEPDLTLEGLRLVYERSR